MRLSVGGLADHIAVLVMLRDTHMQDDRDPSVVGRADTHFIQNVMVDSGFGVIFSTGEGVLLVCGDPLVFLLRARSSLCRSSRRSAPRRPGGWGSPPWRCRKQLSPPGLSRPAHAHHHTSPPACCCGPGRGGSFWRGSCRRRRG